jgi:hypothetical protein
VFIFGIGRGIYQKRTFLPTKGKIKKKVLGEKETLKKKKCRTRLVMTKQKKCADEISATTKFFSNKFSFNELKNIF